LAKKNRMARGGRAPYTVRERKGGEKIRRRGVSDIDFNHQELGIGLGE